MINYIVILRYLYYFLKEEKTDRLELCNVLEGLLHIDPTSELSEEYIKLKMHETGDKERGNASDIRELYGEDTSI